MRFALLSLVLLTITACGPDKLQADIACSRSEACESDGSCAYRHLEELGGGCKSAVGFN